MDSEEAPEGAVQALVDAEQALRGALRALVGLFRALRGLFRALRGLVRAPVGLLCIHMDLLWDHMGLFTALRGRYSFERGANGSPVGALGFELGRLGSGSSEQMCIRGWVETPGSIPAPRWGWVPAEEERDCRPGRSTCRPNGPNRPSVPALGGVRRFAPGRRGGRSTEEDEAPGDFPGSGRIAEGSPRSPERPGDPDAGLGASR